jgi:hypothetical protein
MDIEMKDDYITWGFIVVAIFLPHCHKRWPHPWLPLASHPRHWARSLHLLLLDVHVLASQVFVMHGRYLLHYDERTVVRSVVVLEGEAALSWDRFGEAR